MSKVLSGYWPEPPAFFTPRRVINTAGVCAGNGSAIALGTSLTWGTGSQAIFWPIIVETNLTVSKLYVFNGTVVSGNIDLGLYNPDGVRLSSAGSTAQSGTSAIQSVSVTPFNIAPGLYYLAATLDNTTGTILGRTLPMVSFGRTMGIVQMGSAFPLPATATFATLTQAVVPIVGMMAIPFAGDARLVMPATIHTWSPLSVADSLGTYAKLMDASASAVWPAANRAIFVPFYLPSTMPVTQLFSFNGSAVSGNIDVGIYDIAGVKRVSAGSTAQSGTSTIQTFSVSAELSQGTYYLAQALDNGTGTTVRATFANNSFTTSFGLQQMAAAFPLPATATFADRTDAICPIIGFTSQAVI